MKYLLKAEKDLLLPDGKTTIKVGDTFEWDRPIDIFGRDATVIEEIKETANGGDGDNQMTEEEVRAKAKELKIAGYHNKGIKRLLAEIAEAEAAKTNETPANGGDGENETPKEGGVANAGE